MIRENFLYSKELEELGIKILRSMKFLQNDENYLETAEVAVEEIVIIEECKNHQFDPDDLSALAESIRECGILNPLILEKRSDGYTVRAGCRRLAAAKIVGIKSVPAVIIEPFDGEPIEISIIYNIKPGQDVLANI